MQDKSRREECGQLGPGCEHHTLSILCSAGSWRDLRDVVYEAANRVAV